MEQVCQKHQRWVDRNQQRQTTVKSCSRILISQYLTILGKEKLGKRPLVLSFLLHSVSTAPCLFSVRSYLSSSCSTGPVSTMSRRGSVAWAARIAGPSPRTSCHLLVPLWTTWKTSVWCVSMEQRSVIYVNLHSKYFAEFQIMWISMFYVTSVV